MTITAYPKSGVATSEEQWSKYFENVVDNGPITTDGFKATANGSGMNVSVAPGFGFIRGDAWNSTDDEPLTIEAAPSQSGTARIDTVIAYRDLSKTPIIGLGVVKGTESTSPAAPDLEQGATGRFEWPICDVRVGNGAVSIVQSDVTDRRTFCGMRPRLFTADDMPDAAEGLFGYNLTSGRWQYSDGSQWRDVVAWADLSGKPSTFPPSAHTHSASDITSGALSADRTRIFRQTSQPSSPSTGDVWISW